MLQAERTVGDKGEKEALGYTRGPGRRTVWEELGKQGREQWEMKTEGNEVEVTAVRGDGQ